MAAASVESGAGWFEVLVLAVLQCPGGSARAHAERLRIDRRLQPTDCGIMICTPGTMRPS